MHTYTLSMLQFMLVTSFLALPNLISLVEANRRLITTSNGGRVFKVDLIHRDYSSQSPFHNPSTTLKERRKRFPLGYISRGHNVRLISTYNNTSNSDVPSYDIIPKHNIGEYLLKIDFGTPKVEFVGIPDTGSDLTWIPCLPCKNCATSNTSSSPFDPRKSSTFRAIPCNTSACEAPDVVTSCPVDNTTKSTRPCHYQLTYGDGSGSRGILATDTIGLPSTDASPLNKTSFVFGCGTNQTDYQEDGVIVIGLGSGPSSLIRQLGPTINHKFSYCLPPLTSGGGNGKLAFGADVTAPGLVSTPLIAMNSSHHYHLMLNGIAIGDNEIPMPSSSGLDIIIDSGTTLTFLPPSVYGSIKTALGTGKATRKRSLNGQVYDLCHDSSDKQFDMLDDVVFRFKGGDVVLKKINIFWEVEDGVSCLAMAADNETYLFGNIAQINFHVGYDLEEFKQVSFAPTNCSNF